MSTVRVLVGTTKRRRFIPYVGRAARKRWKVSGPAFRWLGNLSRKKVHRFNPGPNLRVADEAPWFGQVIQAFPTTAAKTWNPPGTKRRI